MYKVLCGQMFSFLLCINLGMELLGHVVIQGLTFQGTARPCSEVYSSAVYESSNLFTSSLTYYVILILAILKGLQ